ncbi:MAG: hypothetical protein IJ065_02150 [Eubacterium sp.]|nr:hypothetical protein [Eubacterium sp.]
MAKSIYESLKEIEYRLEGEEYSAGGVTFYLEVDKLDFDITDMESLKRLFVNYGVIDESYDITLTSVIDKESEIKRICGEWHFNQDITEELTDIVVQSEGYYQAFEGYGWVGNGNVSDLFRILQYKDELILLEFFICD